MKTLLTSFVIAVAASLQAANINWNVTGKGTANNYAGTALSSTVYFVLASDVSSLTGNTSENDFLSALSAITLDSTESTSDGSKPSVASKVISNDKITGSAQTFGMLVYSKDSDGNGYYKLTTANGTGYADGASADAQTQVSTSWTTLRNENWVSAWTKQNDPVNPDPQPGVPEPATGALALAGVALLFKRRRA